MNIFNHLMSIEMRLFHVNIFNYLISLESYLYKMDTFNYLNVFLFSNFSCYFDDQFNIIIHDDLFCHIKIKKTTP